MLPGLPAASIDALITDPPYCSGGMSIAERQRDPRQKYCQSDNDQGRPSFAGDARDQRSFIFWCTTWLRLSRRVIKPGGYALVFIDWRNLPAMTDAIQAAGYTWRGIVPWNKGRSARAPHKGYFRHQCEYVVWGTVGECAKATHAGPFDGCINQAIIRKDKHHMTGKPTPLMRQLVECVPPGGTVLDLFAGSCSTGVAAALEGRGFVGCEQSIDYCAIGSKRLEKALAGELLLAA